MLTLLLALQLVQEYTYDIHGRRTAGPGSLNGTDVTPSQVEEKVLEDAGGRKVIERTIRHTNADGTPIATERVRIEEVKHGGGRVTTSQETYRSDLNGRLTLAERSLTDFRQSGTAIASTTTVSRGNLNGGLELVERAEMTGREDDTGRQTDTQVYRRDTNGSFRPAARSVVERRQENGQTVEKASDYQAATVDGRMQLSAQRVTTEQPANGGTVKQVRIYGMAQAGRPADGTLKLREEQLIEQRKGAGQSVEESFSIRRPDLTGTLPKTFTPISQRVCQVKCN